MNFNILCFISLLAVLIPETKQYDLEMAIFVDSTLWSEYQRNHYGQAEQKLQTFVKSIVHNAQLIYEHNSMPIRINLAVVHYEVLKYQPNSLPISSSGSTYLDYFCNYQSNLRRNGLNWDVAILMTGQKLAYDQAGIGRFKGTCDSSSSCVLVEALSLSASFILAHELGHSVGMHHDEVSWCSSNYIMSSHIGGGRVTWSSCSVNSLQQFIYDLDRQNNNCLRTNLAYKHSSFYFSSVADHLPGRIFDANEQCIQFYGSGYRSYNSYGRTADMCHMMYCVANNGYSPRSSHPALEGTLCGSGKHCSGGQCVSTISYTTPPVTAAYSSTSSVHWTEWSQWSQCSSLSSGCAKTKTRACVSVATAYSPSVSVSGCPGSNSETVSCHDTMCPGTKKASEWKQYSKKYFSSPEQAWGEWSACTASCDQGVQVRYKTGKYPNQEMRTCSSGSCSSWGGWGDWSNCGENRQRTRVRKCYGNGASCPGSHIEAIPC